ncbi:MAG: hypothetical protein JW888_06165 [Pirellulales bacterium]|nr:hypothetical protein [Pirellulales bacterium]
MTLMESDFAAAVGSQLWQVTVLVVAVALVVRLVARNRPHLAHVLWLVVLLKCVTPPWCASPAGLFSRAETWLAAAPPVETAEPLAAGVCFGTFNGSAEPLATLPVDQPVETIPTPTWSWTDWAVAGLAAGWGLGLVVVVARALRRWLRFLRLIRRPAALDSRPDEAFVADLARRLGVRRRVRVRITASRVGPAVVGWIRPTIVLPEILVSGRRAAELEPMLAHELIHLRRGDTWSGLLRMVAETVWWFHPLIGWASRLVSREAERCCDEAVVAELNLRPADYARCLLGVLERKHLLLEPVPAFPGVRPVEVTSQRMERIMRLGQGSRRRSPWWVTVHAPASNDGADWWAR